MEGKWSGKFKVDDLMSLNRNKKTRRTHNLLPEITLRKEHSNSWKRRSGQTIKSSHITIFPDER